MIVVDILQFLAIAGTLVFVGLELRQQSRAIRNQGVLRGFRLYHTLVQQYLDLLSRADREPALNAVWDALEPARRVELDQAQQSQVWGAWHSMTTSERRCYRFTRNVLETFEQAYVVHRLFHEQEWVDEETWQKWRGWMAIWKESPYFAYVFADVRPRMIKAFADNFPAITAADAGPGGDAFLRIPGARERSGTEAAVDDHQGEVPQ